MANVGAHVTNDSTTRLAYSREIKAMAKKLESDALAGITWARAADQAQETRNIKDPRGVSRPFRFYRRFQISGNPKPESPKSSMQELRSASITPPNQAEAHIGHDKEDRPK